MGDDHHASALSQLTAFEFVPQLGRRRHMLNLHPLTPDLLQTRNYHHRHIISPLFLRQAIMRTL